MDAYDATSFARLADFAVSELTTLAAAEPKTTGPVIGPEVRTSVFHQYQYTRHIKPVSPKLRHISILVKAGLQICLQR